MDDTLQNRKLVRPRLSEAKTSLNQVRTSRKKQIPPERTNAENFYYIKQMNNRTPMTLLLNDGEVIHGHIEWYDKMCLKINRDDAPNLLVMKSAIKYMYKMRIEDEDKSSDQDQQYSEEDMDMYEDEDSKSESS